MIKVIIDVSGVQGIFERVTAPGVPTRIAKQVAKEVVRPTLAKYPSASRKKQAFKTAKQRRFFFAALKNGAISVPYSRTGDLGSKWEETEMGDGVELRSLVPYSDLVIGASQAAYHRGTWPTVEQTAEEVEPAAVLSATAELVSIIGDGS